MKVFMERELLLNLLSLEAKITIKCKLPNVYQRFKKISSDNNNNNNKKTYKKKKEKEKEKRTMK